MVSIEEILGEAAKYNASDVHITVGVPPKMRVNGALINMNYPVLTPETAEGIIGTILDKHHKAIYEEKGEVDFSISVPGIGRYRVNVFRQRGVMAAALRIVGTVIPRPEQLGVPKAVQDLHTRKRGLVLVTGPTGSGKSTTLASVINLINEDSTSHIITLEDPIEYMHTHKRAMINQREVGFDTQSYNNALRAALREDPDVILVGEMRDYETISIAVTAAETGHLVFSTLHTIGSAATIDRIIDVFPTNQQAQIRVQLSMVLEAVISQQLLPTADQKRRVAAFEVMISNPAIKNLIREGKTHQIQSMIQTNRKIGMQTMDDALYDLYRRGEITGQTCASYAQDIVNMDKRLRGLA
ncbi:MAG: type IV pilus twitching motility protein PilT [Lachnospiraceae bacterium]|nr:type IV pilus twitching motility protein PilT [Lachnospiraceae bacterium]